MILSQTKIRRSVAAFLTGSFALAATSVASFAQEPAVNAPVDHTQSIKLDDYTSHPLAGSEVIIEIEVKDALNQKGQSRPVTVRLPEYHFTNDMNKELAQMRKILALDWTKSADVAVTLDQFIVTHAGNIKDGKIVDDLQKIQRILAGSANIDELDRIVSRDMWQVMMALEEDVLPEAEKNLRDIEEALRRALEEGMNPEDLQKLVEQSQKAMKEFLKEQLEQAQEQSSDQQGESGENGENSEPNAKNEEEKQALEDMQKMLEEMQKMMEELGMTPEQQAEMMQQMMQNMQNMAQAQNSQQRRQSQMSMQQQMQQMQQQMQQAQEMSNELEELIKKQQDLMDESSDISDMTEEELLKLQQQINEISKEIEGQLQDQMDIESDKGQSHEQGQENIRKLKYEKTRLENDRSFSERPERPYVASPSMLERRIDSLNKALKVLDEFREKNDDAPQEQQQGQDGQQNQSDGQGQQQPKDLQPEINNLEQQVKQLADQLRNMEQRQQDMQQQVQDMARKMQQMNMHPRDLIDAKQHMENSARDLRSGKPGDAVPDQNQAIQSMQAAQEQLKMMMQQMMMGSGAPSAGYGGLQEEAPHAPLGRSNPNEIIGIDPQDNVNGMRRQRDEIRNQLDQGNLPAVQRQYLERLLNGLTPSKPTP